MDRSSRSSDETRQLNRVVAGAHFSRRFLRAPYLDDDPRSTINDLIFNRMINPDWSPSQLAFVDKETAKAEVCKMLPTLLVPRTLAVVPMDGVQSADHLYQVLRPFAGTESIAKPTHASGVATFLRNVSSAADVESLFKVASSNYATIMREMQYDLLPKKIVVEDVVPTAAGLVPDDYKFHCVGGEPLVCQVDHSRFASAWSRLLLVPDLTPMHAGDGLSPPAGYQLPQPDRIKAMVTTAKVLSARFDYVRVDLYNGSDGIYFGELTFTPGGSLGVAPSRANDESGANATHRIFSDLIMNALRRDCSVSLPATN